ncbi:MAG: EAL domain-containing protein [Planctomycetota bacterium]
MNRLAMPFLKTRSHRSAGPRRPNPARRPARRRLFGNTTVSWLACFTVLALTAGTVVYLEKGNRAADDERFDRLKEKLHSEIVRRVTIYRYGLMGTRSVFAASDRVDRDAFRRIVASREMKTEFPAATGMGYVHRVAKPELNHFLETTRADGVPDYSVQMLADRIAHSELYLVKYIEPEAPNRSTIGLDIGQEARRRAAAETAMRTGDAAITQPITLVQASGNGPGFLILLPFYRPGAPAETEAQRVEALEGWVYMTLLAEEVFRGVTPWLDHEIDFKVFDGEAMRFDAMLFDAEGGYRPQSDMDLWTVFKGNRHHDSVPIEIGGRRWTVAITATDRFHAESRAGVWMAGIGGLVFAGLLLTVMHLQSYALKKARGIAASMTADLRLTAMTDRLTGLPNRASILERVREAMSRARRIDGYHYAVLFLDFDRFKVINDSLGHTAGDMLLRSISQRLRNTLRPHDAAAHDTRTETAARLGGDEFIVLLDGIAHPTDAVLVAERLISVLNEPHQLGSREVRSTASIGVVCGGPAYDQAEDVVRDADTAMYEAKADGPGKFKVFDAEMRRRANERLDIENDLHNALTHGEFVVEYQPILALDSRRIESFEALVRWEHPEHGRIGPDRFIPIAEETGIIVPLGQWVLHRALRDLSRWRKAGVVDDHCCVSVNLSRRQLVLPELFDTVTLALRKHDVPARCLHLEVTESQIMQERDAAMNNLGKLRRAGIQIDLDDFGTGYSSLACLHDFPVDLLKIDRAFIANLEHDDSLVSVLTTVIDLARNLDIGVVAEGVETDEQVDTLDQLACGYVQGYRFSRPLPADGVPLFCDRHGREDDTLRLAA